MNAITRIFAVLKVLIAEVSTVKYLISSGLFLSFLVFAYFVDESNTGSVLQSNLLIVDEEAIGGCLNVAAFIAALIITLSSLSKWFKEENQATTFLTLPVTNWERFVALLFFSLVFVPLVVILPILLWILCGYALAPDFVVLPPIQIISSHVSSSIISHWGVFCLYLAPMIAFPRKIGWGVAIFFLLIPGYLIYTRAYLQPPSETIELTQNVFSQTDVVGMASSNTLRNEKPDQALDYSRDIEPDLPGIVSVLAMLAFVSVGYLTLTRKTS